MKIASWNVNSIRARLDQLCWWLQTSVPDVVLLQEIKCLEEQFPKEPLEDLGYNVAILGQKTYNGVAILSKRPLEDITCGLPGDDARGESRYIEAVVGTVRVASVYVPNGQEVGTEKFRGKLDFFQKLKIHCERLLTYKEALVLGGDYNVAPTDYDVYDPMVYRNCVLVTPEERLEFSKLLHAGLEDGLRIKFPEETSDNTQLYTWWDYRQAGFRRNHGLRLDHLLLSPQAVGLLREVGIDRAMRAQDRPSDHAPIWCVLE